jgi:2-polyprenyl-3-methyl-5-hydroxy-6-metoxy-1,4-benzoquinol methylase
MRRIANFLHRWLTGPRSNSARARPRRPGSHKTVRYLGRSDLPARSQLVCTSLPLADVRATLVIWQSEEFDRVATNKTDLTGQGLRNTSCALLTKLSLEPLFLTSPVTIDCRQLRLTLGHIRFIRTVPFTNILTTSISLSHRHLRPEVMDQSGLDTIKHRSALAGLRRLNFASGVCHQLFRELSRYSRFRGVANLRVLDIASGGGDVPFGLWKLAKRRGLDLRILGLDVSAAACEFATEQCRPAGCSILFEQCDATCDVIPSGFDVVTCSLFLHHLTCEQAANLLMKMAAAGRLLLANDLRRCAAGYLLAHLACRFLTRSPIVRYDGPQSVANAFTATEMRELCVAAGLADATVQKIWPCRMLVRRQES